MDLGLGFWGYSNGLRSKSCVLPLDGHDLGQDEEKDILEHIPIYRIKLKCLKA